MTDDEAEAIWKQTAAEREIGLARARATYNEVCAAVERDFASSLAHRVVDVIVAQRGTAS